MTYEIRLQYHHPKRKSVLFLITFAAWIVACTPAWCLSCGLDAQNSMDLYDLSGNYLGDLQGPQNFEFESEYICSCEPDSDYCSCSLTPINYDLRGVDYLRIKGTDYLANPGQCTSQTAPAFTVDNRARNRPRRYTCKTQEEC